MLGLADKDLADKDLADKDLADKGLHQIAGGYGEHQA